MLKEIISALRSKLEETGTLDVEHFDDDSVLVLGIQSVLPHECLHPDGRFLNLMACVLSGQMAAVKALTYNESNIRNVMYYLDFLYETTFYGYVDASEIEELKDQVISITF
ncbi:hypothetical protein [Vibrio phage phiKT1019]|nr:hypothetical protein [Vibrio phage phiKT1019]